MITLKSKDSDKVNLVVGDFYIVDHNPSAEAHSYIIKNPGAYAHYAERSEANKKLLDELELLKLQNPLSCGIYEDWRAAVDLNQYRITEAVARQYQALDYILAQCDTIDIGTALYMLKRIERSYNTFVEIRETGGDVAAKDFLESIREHGEIEYRQKMYFARLIERIHSKVPPCLDFFGDNHCEKYIRALLNPKGFLKPARFTVDNLTVSDILAEYLARNKA